MVSIQIFYYGLRLSLVSVLVDLYTINDDLSIWSVHFSPDGQSLATASSDDRIRVRALELCEFPSISSIHRYGTLLKNVFEPPLKDIQTSSPTSLSL